MSLRVPWAPGSAGSRADARTEHSVRRRGRPRSGTREGVTVAPTPARPGDEMGAVLLTGVRVLSVRGPAVPTGSTRLIGL